ncbi:MAG: ATP-binding protein, partial [Sorangiineae bacterium PRO1]|nr:ATP-binding protein [Sorangiineae bacterium PRO1]
MSAKAIIERLEKDKWVEVERWVTDTEPEGVHLDFKRRSATGDKFDDKELATVAKAMSAFANVEGGVLAFGVSTRPSAAGSDRVDKLITFPDFEKIANQVDRRIAGLTDPPVAGARVLPFEDPKNRGHGIVVVYVPDSESGPHQAAFGEGAARYFIRTS